MRALDVWVFLNILGYFNVVHTLTIPFNRIGLQGLGNRQDQYVAGNIKGYHVSLEAREKPKPAKPSSKTQPPKPTGKTIAKKPTEASAAKPTVTPSPTKPSPNKVPSSSPVSTVSPLPFIKEPRPTNAYDICNLPGFDCEGENEDFVEALGKGNDDDDGIPQEHGLEKRSTPRLYSVVVGGGTPTMMMTSLPYPLEAKLFPAGSPKVILDFLTDNVRDASFKMFAAAPKRTKPSKYIVEHIVELQSIMLFIKAAIRDRKVKGITSLSEHVDISFFTKNWSTKDSNVQKQIASRPTPFSGYSPSTALSSLNDLVFEAMGSKSNTADFVLCEEGVNSMKAKLWSHVSPFTSTKWQDIARNAADGSIPSNRHLSGMRSILGVHNYLNDPDVTKRLQDTVKNIKTEFGNFKYITGEDVKDVNGKTVDLSALWIEFMSAQLQKVFESGTKWLKEQIDYATPKYKAHLSDLQQALKRITDEESLKDNTKRQEAIDKRIEESNKLIKQLPNDKTALSQAEISMETAQKVLEVANAALRKQTPATRSALLKDRKKKYDTKVLAEEAYYEAMVTKGRREREIIKLRRTELTALIKDVEADIKQLTDYRAEAVAMKTPKAE